MDPNVQIRPSALPMLKVSPMFRTGEGTSQVGKSGVILPPNEFAEAGTFRHHSLQLYWERGESVLMDHDEDEQDAIKWAAEQIRILAPTTSEPVNFNIPVLAYLMDFDTIAGTADAACGSHIFDLKWRPRDYTAQMAAYALAWIQTYQIPVVKAHVLYGWNRKLVTIEFDEKSAAKEVNTIVQRVKEATECAVSEYCSWCSFRKRCPLYVDPAFAIAKGREDWSLQTYHSSEISNPAEMGKALRLARHIKKWVESVEHFALQMATREGVVPEGFEMGVTKGKTYINDINQAFQIANLPPNDFLKCCDVRLNTSKKYPDKAGLVDTYAEANGLTKVAAKKKLTAALAPCTARGMDSPKLVAVGDDEPEGDF